MRRGWLMLAVLAALAVATIPSLQAWFGHNSALKEADAQAIEWLNDQKAKAEPRVARWRGHMLALPANITYTASTQVAPWIYGRFLDLEYVESVEEADFVVWRSEPMTPRCDPENAFYKWDKEPTELEEYEGLKLRLRVTRDSTEVRVYEGGQ